MGDGGQHPVGARHRCRPGVEQQEASGPIGVLRSARSKAGLSEECRLLIAEIPGDRHPGQHSPSFSEHGNAGKDLGEQRRRYPEGVE